MAFCECQYLDIDLTAYGENTPFPMLGGKLTGDDVGNLFDSYIATFRIYVPKGRKAELASMTNWADCASVIMEV
jgi:hypothetical protein